MIKISDTKTEIEITADLDTPIGELIVRLRQAGYTEFDILARNPENDQILIDVINKEEK
jgi:hypothetical protein